MAVWDFAHVDARAFDVMNRRDNVPPSLVNRIRESLGIATDRQLRTVDYWSDLLDMSPNELRAMLASKEVDIGSKRKLPSSAHKVLRTIARSRRIDPRTGVVRPPDPPSQLATEVEDSVPPPPDFSQVGRRRNLSWLTVDQVFAIHEALVTDFAQHRDPIDPPGVRDPNLLGSAVFRPQTSHGEVLKYPTVETSAAALLCALIHDHPFHNGNKRTALVAALAFLDEHGLVLRCDEDALFRFVLLIAKHKITKRTRHHFDDHETYAVAQEMAKWSTAVGKSEHPMSFLKLRQNLEKHACHVTIKSGRADIVRKVPRRQWLLPARRLHTQVYYRNPGSDVPKETIKKIRKDLQLDYEHGIDEADFYSYSRKTTPINEFIAVYRKTLDRLARL